MIEILYRDDRVVVCVKPAGVLSTDEEGGLPSLLREQLGLEHTPHTVHRLDRAVGGVMVLALTKRAAADLTKQVTERTFGKEYRALVHGHLPEKRGTFTDLLGRDKARKMTYVAEKPGKDIREAVLDYEVLEEREGMSLVAIRLHTGRTHQIRVQFASRGFPLVGERKYSGKNDPCSLALRSHRVAFDHPRTGERMEFTADEAFPLGGRCQPYRADG